MNLARPDLKPVAAVRLPGIFQCTSRAALHIHIKNSLEPALRFALARNRSESGFVEVSGQQDCPDRLNNTFETLR